MVEVLGGGVQVDVVGVVAAKEVSHVKGAGHGEQAGEDVGVTEGDIGGVEASKAAAERDQVLIPVFIADERNDLVDEVVFVLDVAGDSPVGADVAVVPASPCRPNRRKRTGFHRC